MLQILSYIRVYPACIGDIVIGMSELRWVCVGLLAKHMRRSAKAPVRFDGAPCELRWVCAGGREEQNDIMWRCSTEHKSGPDDPVFPFFPSPPIFLSAERMHRLGRVSIAGDRARKKIGPSSASSSSGERVE
jgi:hypothetical protein